MRRSKKLLQLTREIYEAGKPLAFICHAGWVPISAGIVRGKRGTSVGGIKDDLVNAGLIWEDSPVKELGAGSRELRVGGSSDPDRAAGPRITVRRP
jgi:putative intracellular protease/amidase